MKIHDIELLTTCALPEWCLRCLQVHGGLAHAGIRLCPVCKRANCPHIRDHRDACTNPPHRIPGQKMPAHRPDPDHPITVMMPPSMVAWFTANLPAGTRLLPGGESTWLVLASEAFKKQVTCPVQTCFACTPEPDAGAGTSPFTFVGMKVCPDCGNKRCPHVADHNLACTRSNEPGQEGSVYP